MKRFFLSFVLIYFLFSNVPLIHAQQRTEQMEGQIQSIENTTKTIEGNNQLQKIHKMTIVVTSGQLTNKVITVEDFASAQARQFNVGDTVIIGTNKDLNGNESYYISDFVRRTPIFLLFLLFVGLVLLIGKKKGFTAIIGLCASILIIYYFVIPNLLSGTNPILITLAASLFIIPITYYFAHGFDRKTTAAVIGTFICLVVTILIALFFVEAAKLSGFSSDEASFVKMMKGDINIKGLLLAGVIIGLLGVLDDITIAQANIVFQLKHAQEKLTSAQLYTRAMIIGKDHIASMVNTLILVYTGASLPLLLLFTNNSAPFSEVINYEIVAEEIVRTLISSIGLILAVPLTTYIAVIMVRKNQ